MSLFGNGAGGFGPVTNYSSGGTDPTSVAVGDFTGDGKPDLAVANYQSNTVSVLLGNGSGGFAAAATFSSGGSDPGCVAVGDFNGDGKLDLVVANYGERHRRRTPGQRLGGFAAATTFSTGGSDPESIAVGDFNGDGKLDIAVADVGSGTVGVLLGNGSGGFAAAVAYSTGGSDPDSVAVGDFNGDGKLDLAVANYGSNTVGILLGNGNGTFAAATTFSSGGSYPESVAVGDFNGDGKLDLAVANYGSNNVGVLLGNGSGRVCYGHDLFQRRPEPESVAVGDFNGDGKLDLAVANDYSGSVGVLLGNGAGGFAAATTFSSSGSASESESVAVGDFNGDGKPDLAVTNYGSNTVGVLINSTSPVVQPMTSAAGTTYQVQTGGLGAGQIAAASNGAYDGMGRLRVGGADYTPPLATANLINGGSTAVTPSASHGRPLRLAQGHRPGQRQPGLRPHRRYLPESHRQSPITTTVTILGNLGSDAATTVFATSDGTGVVSTNDQWIGTDNGSGGPAVITYIHGPLGLVPTSVSLIGDNITWTYSLTVPAGQTVELAYFTIVGATRAGCDRRGQCPGHPDGLRRPCGRLPVEHGSGRAGEFLPSTFPPRWPLRQVPWSASTAAASAQRRRSRSAASRLPTRPSASSSNGATVGTATTNATGTASLPNISLAVLPSAPIPAASP